MCRFILYGGFFLPVFVWKSSIATSPFTFFYSSVSSISIFLLFIPNLILELICYKKLHTLTSMLQLDRDTHTNTFSPDSTHCHITAYVLPAWVSNLGADMLFPFELVSFQRRCFCFLLNYIHHSFFKAENMTAVTVGRKAWDWCTSFLCD